MDYDNLRKAEAIPKASSMIETLRSIGYSLETAIADIIDNSISAKAKNIYVRRIWRGGKSVIAIKDDGDGMNGNEIIQAMRPCSKSIDLKRSETDLGRFGLGLKTASFSQCRKFSVLSKRRGFVPVFWSWDLDYVAESKRWELIQWIPEEFKNELDSLQSGTIVIWTDLDRIVSLQTVEMDESAKQTFSFSMEKVKNHIAMTFHQFLEDKTIKIFWGINEIEAWNPFCPNESKTQEQPTENIVGGVKMKGYVLPHKNSFSTEQAYKKAEGVSGYLAMQGFYVYRGKRLLLAGSWLNFFRKEEQYKLVRIQIDLTNRLDSEWKIDIRKSRACPPVVCYEQLKSYAKSVRSIGLEVYRHRGRILKQRAGQLFQPLWIEKKKDNKWSIVVNREHLMIQELKDLASKKPEWAIEKLLKFLEETIPTKTIYINEAQDNERIQKTPFPDVDTNIVKEMLLLMYENQIIKGKTPEQVKVLLKKQEPFNNYEDLIDEL